MPEMLDIRPGDVYHFLTVVRELDRHRDAKGRPSRVFEFQCDCGNRTIRPLNAVRSGNTKSCGCYHGISISERSKTHGKSKTRLYKLWLGMRSRCNTPSATGYQLYGGRGIKVCERWGSYETFVADMGPRPPGASIERVDNDGDYTPENCRWATDAEQRRNKRTSNIVDFQGRSQTVRDWADEIGVNYYTLHRRITRLGWSVGKALATPPARAVGIHAKRAANA